MIAIGLAPRTETTANLFQKNPGDAGTDKQKPGTAGNDKKRARIVVQQTFSAAGRRRNARGPDRKQPHAFELRQ
jgi:hypothetical protein